MTDENVIRLLLMAVLVRQVIGYRVLFGHTWRVGERIVRVIERDEEREGGTRTMLGVGGDRPAQQADLGCPGCFSHPPQQGAKLDVDDRPRAEWLPKLVNECRLRAGRREARRGDQG